MKDFRPFFKDKKITVMGLGLLGRGVGDVAYLAECGVKLTVTDLKTREQLRESLKKLLKFKNIKYVLGKHRLEDFRNCDMVLKSAGVSLDSIYIKEAKKHNIPVEMSASIFAKLSGIPMVGVTGTRGKSTVTHLIANILKKAGRKVILGGNIRGVSNLQLLKKKGDISVFELDSWQLQGFGESKVSPHVAVFTNFMSDHMNYYKNNLKNYFKDKSYIYKFQNKKDILVLGSKMKVRATGAKSKIINVAATDVPKSWHTNLAGRHNIENIACAMGAAKALGIKDEIIKKAVQSFVPLAGRLEMVKKVRGVSIYNDTNSTTPDAVIAALKSFDKKVIAILGGMDKGLDVAELNRILPLTTKKVFLTPGSGSDRIGNKKADIEKVLGLKEAVVKSAKEATKGDIILFSPAFASFNMFKNEYDRGDRFMKLVKNLR